MAINIVIIVVGIMMITAVLKKAFKLAFVGFVILLIINKWVMPLLN